MTKFEQIKQDVINQLQDIGYDTTSCDLSDLGNEIGIVIGRHIDNYECDIDSFIDGVRHGISLIDGTH